MYQYCSSQIMTTLNTHISTYHVADGIYFQTSYAHMWILNGPDRLIDVNFWAYERGLNYLKLTENDVQFLLLELMLTK